MDAPDLITLEEFKRTRDINEAVDDDLIVQFIHAASRVVWGKTGRHFVPYIGTRVYDGMGQHLQQQRTALDLDDDLLVLTAATDAGTVLTLSDLVLENANFPPYWRIRHKPETGLRWGGTSTLSSIVITGWWGFHEGYAHAWSEVATLAASIDATQTTIALSNIQDVSRLSYLRVGDEIMQVDHVVEDSEDIIVHRGVRGTIGAVATSSAPVKAYRGVDDVAHATSRLVSFYYDRRDTVGERVSFGSSAMLLEGAIPPEIMIAIQARSRLSMMFM
jgi:hypothetical protein